MSNPRKIRDSLRNIVVQWRLIICLRLMSVTMRIAPKDPDGDEIILGIARIVERMSPYAGPHE